MGSPTAISENKGWSLRALTSPFSLGDLGRQEERPPGATRPRGGPGLAAIRPPTNLLLTTPAA